MQVESAIARCRRDIVYGALLKAVLLGSAAVCVVLGSISGNGGTIALAGIGGIWIIWMTLNVRSAKASRIAAESPGLIAAGEFERAEANIDEALRSFSLIRAVKLTCLHYLLILRHKQRRWSDVATLAQAILNQPLGSLRTLNTHSRLILADALLEMNDTKGAYNAINALYNERLSLAEALYLTVIQLDYEARMQAWGAMLTSLTRRIQMSELMPSNNAARTQAFLALAALKMGKMESTLR